MTDAFQATKPDPREAPSMRPLGSDADVSIYNFYTWFIKNTQRAVL